MCVGDCAGWMRRHLGGKSSCTAQTSIQHVLLCGVFCAHGQCFLSTSEKLTASNRKTSTTTTILSSSVTYNRLLVAMETLSFPVLAPSKRPRKAVAAFSRPSTTVSLFFSFPSCNQRARDADASGISLDQSVTMNPRINKRLETMLETTSAGMPGPRPSLSRSIGNC